MQAVVKMAILAKFRQLTWRFLCKLHQQRWAWHVGEFDDFGDFYANYVVDHKLNATHAQLLEKLRPIALAEKCRFLAIQSLEFQEIWPKNRSETTWMIYHEKSEFSHREFLVIQETIDGELRKLPMSKFY